MSYELKTTLASLPGTVRGFPMVLGGDPKGKNFLYCNGNYVYIRDIEDPSKCDVYAEHQYQTSAAKYAPSGFYIASGGYLHPEKKSHPSQKPFQYVTVPHGIKLCSYFFAQENILFMLRNDKEQDYTQVSQEKQWTKSLMIKPSGKIAKAKVYSTGKVRIWDTTNEEHILKAEYQPISGVIKDIAWSPDSKRMVVVGEGREKFGHVFLFDSGSSVGEINGHSKAINSVDYKQTRPFRIVTGSEDFTSIFFEGPPFKFKTSIKDHSRFVQTVRFSPNGEFFATGGADGKVCIYNGKDASKVSELGDGKAHTGGIYAMCWSPDGSQLLTVSGDKSAKIWDVNDNACKTEFKMGSEVMDQQVGCLWQGDHIVTVSLSGAINYLDKNNPETPMKIIRGHNKLISAMTASEDGSTFYTASTDGRVVVWDAASGASDVITGRPHANQVNGMTVVGDKVATIGMDDKVKFFSMADKSYGDAESPTGSQPRSITSSHGGLIVIGCINQILIFRSDVKSTSLSVQYEALSVAIHPNHQEIAVGSHDARIYIYSLDSSDVLTEKKELHVKAAIHSLQYSPDGKFLCSGGSSKEVKVFTVAEDYKEENFQWLYHTASINQVRWSPDSQHIASCSLDTNIMIWNVEKHMDRIYIKRAHPRANIRNINWLSPTTIVSAADDCCVKIWDITHK